RVIRPVQHASVVEPQPVFFALSRAPCDALQSGVALRADRPLLEPRQVQPSLARREERQGLRAVKEQLRRWIDTATYGRSFDLNPKRAQRRLRPTRTLSKMLRRDQALILTVPGKHRGKACFGGDQPLRGKGTQH